MDGVHLEPHGRTVRGRDRVTRVRVRVRVRG